MRNFKAGYAMADHPCVVGMAHVVTGVGLPLQLFELGNLGIEIGEPVLDT